MISQCVTYGLAFALGAADGSNKIQAFLEGNVEGLKGDAIDQNADCYAPRKVRF